MSNELLVILGAIISFLLSVNAYYFKDIVKTLTEIKVTLAALTAEHDNSVKLVDKHDRDIDKLKERVAALEQQ